MRKLLEGDIASARQMLRDLLDGTPLTLKPIVVNGVRRYAFAGSGSISDSYLLTSHVRWWPQRGYD